MSTSDLINLLVENNISREDAKKLVEEKSYKIALKKYDGSYTYAERYISILYNIIDSFYKTVKPYQFSKKNNMVSTIIDEINSSFKENENNILNSEERIKEFIKDIIVNNKDLSSEKNYANILDSIIAFINCERKDKIYAVKDEKQKILNKLFTIDNIDLETINGIIESLTIVADSHKVSSLSNDEIVQAMDTMMKNGLESNTVKPVSILDSLDAICNVINSCQGKSEESILEEFYNTILEDYEMYNNNKKCKLEDFFANIKSNSRDIKLQLDRMKEQEQESKKKVNKSDLKTNGKKDLTRLSSLPNKLQNIIKSDKLGKAKLALTLVGMTMVALGTTKVYRHFKVPTNGTIIDENDNLEQTEDTYFVDEQYEDDSITYNNSQIVEMPDNLYKLPIRINTRTNTNWGTHGPKEETEIVAMVDANGKIYKFIYIDTDGKIQEITNPIQIETYKDYVYTNIDGYVQDYIEGQMGYSIENSIEPSAYKLTSDFEYTTNVDETNETEEFENEEYVVEADEETQEESSIEEQEEIDSNIEEQKENNSSIEELEDNEIEDKNQNQTITLKQGEWILGFVVVENDNIVIRYIDQNGKNQDIPISYFDNSSLPYDHEWQIENMLLKDSISIQAKEDIPLFDKNHSNFIGVIKAGQKFQFDFVDEGKSCVAKLNGCILGYLDEVLFQEPIEELSNDIYDNNNYVDDLVDENIPINPVNDEYYNGIRIPKQLENEQIAAFLMDNYNSKKMPNTKFNENYGTMIEIDASQDINYILKRIENIIRITGMPYGIELSLNTKEDIDKLVKFLEKIQNSKYADYFQNGVIIKKQIENDQYYYDPYYGYNIESADYTEDINSIKELYNKIKEKGLNPSVLKDPEDKINIESFDPKEISKFTLISKVDGEKYSKEMQELYNKLIEEGFQIVGVIDNDSARMSFDDETVNEGIKNIADKIIIQPNIENYEENPYFFGSNDDDESLNDNTQEEAEATVGNVQEEDIEFY